MPIPFIIADAFAVDNLIIGLAAFAIAVTINAEAQGFVANLLRYDEVAQDKRFFSFNPLAHLDPFALAAFLFCGFGWPRRVLPSLAARSLRHRLAIQLAGPVANLLLANIIGSIMLILGKMNAELLDEKAINAVMVTNVAFGIYNLLLPLPPLAMGNLAGRLVTPVKKETATYIAGLLVLFSLLLFEFVTGRVVLSGILNDITRTVFLFMKP